MSNGGEKLKYLKIFFSSMEIGLSILVLIFALMKDIETALLINTLNLVIALFHVVILNREKSIRKRLKAKISKIRRL